MNSDRTKATAFGADADSFDAIVVGAGAAGGLASLLLTEANLRVLTLDAGWTPPLARAPYRRTLSSVVPSLAALRRHGALPQSLATFGQKVLKAGGRVRQPVQSRSFAWMLAPSGFVDDRDFPYSVAPGSRFDWFRSHQVGGRMIIPGHGRQYHRIRPDVFAAPISPEGRWPIAYDELSPWYDFVEGRLGMAGREADNDATAVETQTIKAIAQRWPGAAPTLGRSAAPLVGLEKAKATGRLTLAHGAVVSRVNVDGQGRATGVTWVDRATKSQRSARAPIVFLCASALESTRILLSSQSERAPNGLGARSNALGRYVMDHITLSCDGAGAPFDPEEPETPGRCVHVQRFNEQFGDGAGRYNVQLYRWSIGKERSHFTAVSFAEMAPRPENRVTLDPDRRDVCGNPVLRFECAHDARDVAAGQVQARALRGLADLFEVSLTRLDTKPAPLGTAMHECGTARMGDDPAKSVLNPNNECWDAKGLYVTDGAALPSQGSQHPTLTIMALTARACAHAVRTLPLALAAITANLQTITPALT